MASMSANTAAKPSTSSAAAARLAARTTTPTTPTSSGGLEGGEEAGGQYTLLTRARCITRYRRPLVWRGHQRVAQYQCGQLMDDECALGNGSVSLTPATLHPRRCPRREVLSNRNRRRPLDRLRRRGLLQRDQAPQHRTAHVTASTKYRLLGLASRLARR